MGLHIISGILGNESDYDNLNWLVLGTTLAVVLSFSFLFTFLRISYIFTPFIPFYISPTTTPVYFLLPLKFMISSCIINIVAHILICIYKYNQVNPISIIGIDIPIIYNYI